MEFTLEIFRSVQAGDPFAFRAGPQEYVLRTPLGGLETLTLTWDETLISELTMLQRPDRDPVLIQRIGEQVRGSIVILLDWRSGRVIRRARHGRGHGRREAKCQRRQRGGRR